MERGEEPIPESWVEAIAEATGGAVSRADWPTIEPTPRFGSLSAASPAGRVARRLPVPVGMDQQQGPEAQARRAYTPEAREVMRQVGQRLARAHRVRGDSPVYKWLDSLQPARNVAWLAAECGVSRQSMQNYIRGEREQRGRVAPVAVPRAIVARIAELSGGAVGADAWDVVESD
jgi:hypothetical protein